MDEPKVVDFRGRHAIASYGQPDQDVVDEIKTLLARAESGELSGLAWSAAFSDNTSMNHFVGVATRSQVGGLFGLMSRISQQLNDI